VTSAEETQMITTVPIRNNPALYLKLPIRNPNQQYPDGKKCRICRDPHVSASARS